MWQVLERRAMFIDASLGYKPGQVVPIRMGAGRHGIIRYKVGRPIVIPSGGGQTKVIGYDGVRLDSGLNLEPGLRFDHARKVPVLDPGGRRRKLKDDELDERDAVTPRIKPKRKLSLNSNRSAYVPMWAREAGGETPRDLTEAFMMVRRQLHGGRRVAESSVDLSGF